MSLLTILKAMGLEMLLLPLEELGVETPDDLQLLEEDAIQELKGNYIQKKKLKVLIEQHKSSGQEVNNNKLLVDLAKKTEVPNRGHAGDTSYNVACFSSNYYPHLGILLKYYS